MINYTNLAKSFPFFFILFAITFHGCKAKQEVDTIILNAKIYTVDNNFSVVQAAAISDGKFIELASTAKIQAKYNAKTNLDLKGKYIYPGLIDPHCHFYGYATTLSEVDLTGTKSINEVIERVKKHQNEFNREWITGRGWDQNDWENKEFPTKEAFDSAFPNTPVLLRRVDGHAAIANSKALKLAGINITTKIKGGKILKENNEISGILIDKAIELVLKVIPKPNEVEQTNNLLKAQKNCFAVGLTSVGEAGLEKKDIMLIDTLQKTDQLKMKLYAMLEPTNENIEHYLKKGHYKTDKLSIRSIKLYADGALGSRGACMLEPYSDDTLNYGLIVLESDSLKHLCNLANEYNYQVNTHCIGDSANRLMLNIYSEILKEQNNKRWRIEHAQVIHPDDFAKFGQFNIIPSVQATHCTSDMYWAIDRLGTERIKGAYAWQKLIKENGWLINGSDFPVESINPLFGFYAAVTRQDQHTYPEKGFYIDQKLSRAQALKAMTIWAARAQFEESEKGSIEPGKTADFIVTSKDIMSCDTHEAYNVKVEQTYVNGQKVSDINE